MQAWQFYHIKDYVNYICITGVFHGNKRRSIHSTVNLLVTSLEGNKE